MKRALASATVFVIRGQAVCYMAKLNGTRDGLDGRKHGKGLGGIVWAWALSNFVRLRIFAIKRQTVTPRSELIGGHRHYPAAWRVRRCKVPKQPRLPVVERA
eukprot:6186050-Pleurochrysis_carterae.AAC.2